MLDTDSSRQVFEPELNQKTDSIFYALGILQALQQVADQYMFQGEVRGDLVETTEFTDNHLRQLANFTATTACRYDSAYAYYRVINNCNYYIAHRDTTLRTGATPVAMNEYVAIKALRAWTYMQLARVYGEVPFYTEPLTQISQIDGADFPVENLQGIVDALAPDLEQYTGYATPNYGNTAPSDISPAYLFIPVDVVLGDMYLETNQFDKAARHYVTYLTEVVPQSRNHTAFMQNFTMSRRSLMELLPSDFTVTTGGVHSNWSSIFTGTNDLIAYIPMAPNSLQGATTQIPLAFGYDYYSTTPNYIDEIQLVPSQSYLALTDNQDYYYISSESTSTKTVVSSTKIGDLRFSGISREDEDNETNITTTWITKNRTADVILYRNTTVWLHLAEAFNRLGMYDAAFAILKDGINKSLVVRGDGEPLYMTEATKTALETTYPLLSGTNISKFSEPESYYGVHMHGSGYLRDYTGNVYQPGLSPYQLDTIVGLKLDELAQQYGVAVGTTPQDTLEARINAMEDILCDEYALEFAFEGCRYYDLMRLARHKNAKSPAGYPANFGYVWLQNKLAGRGWDETKMYLPFK